VLFGFSRPSQSLTRRCKIVERRRRFAFCRGADNYRAGEVEDDASGGDAMLIVSACGAHHLDERVDRDLYMLCRELSHG
jgi:hypothetical protein